MLITSYLALLERLFLISLCSNDYFLSRFARTIISYLALLERLLQELQLYAAVLLLAFVGIVIGNGTSSTVALGAEQ